MHNYVLNIKAECFHILVELTPLINAKNKENYLTSSFAFLMIFAARLVVA